VLTTNRRAYRVNRVNRPPNFAGTRETTTHEGEWGGAEWSADHPGASGGSMAAVAMTDRGPFAVGHDGDGHAIVWSLGESPPAPIEPPDVDDLYAIAPIGGSILVAAPNAPSTPLLVLTQGGWAPLRLGSAETTTLRAVSADNGQFVVAGDGGLGVKVWRGSLD
jgi:hypothetical protein